ncbi:uncharacterized protein SOCG_01446 [Schizosaccharomyces octosporus yFS286]|uniref:Fungal protein n=1 Tax=Schizosaccharomyces octosporus (strain yFS286) TaxID=483514 RepID=S9PUP0_SCHOY|nr:uncharacterized protein SOCG_01446 [Schizosaccharomyces octosporus yFS286]EPX71228.1 fungal protein [Schizosaccharomyces octosporus yFS286]
MPETKLAAHSDFQLVRDDPNYVLYQPYKSEENKSLVANYVHQKALAFCPYYFVEKSGKGSVVFFYPNEQLCGYKNILHGGFIASMLDEALAYGIFGNFASRLGVTVNLDITYVAPSICGHLYKIVCNTTKIEGRKGWIYGELYRLSDNEEPTLCVKATGFFVEPSKLNLEKHV